MSDETHKIKTAWYEKKEYYAAAALVLGGVKQFTPPDAAVHQLCDYLVTIGLPLVMGYVGINNAPKYGTPSGLSKAVLKTKDAVKNSLAFKKNYPKS